jgi:hypothetical protein
MKTKFFGIGISLMLITTFFCVAESVHLPVNNSLQKENMVIETSVDVPVWSIGNSWSYQINTMSFDYDDVNASTSLHVTVYTDEITLTVIDDSGDSYHVELNAALQGSGSVHFIYEGEPIDMDVLLKETELTGTILFNKTDLGIRQIHPVLKGTVLVKFNEQPLPFTIPQIPVPATIDITTDSSVPYPLIQFPLNETSYWGLPATNITVDGTIESGWLRVAYILNRFAQNHWPLVTLLAGVMGVDPYALRAVSDLLANPDILPVFHIGEFLNLMINTSTIQFPAIDPIFFWNVTETITVPAGTFSAFNISVAEGLGSLYYAPEAGTIVKISGQFNDIIPFMTNLTAELTDYNYS